MNPPGKDGIPLEKTGSPWKRQDPPGKDGIPLEKTGSPLSTAAAFFVCITSASARPQRLHDLKTSSAFHPSRCRKECNNGDEKMQGTTVQH